MLDLLEHDGKRRRWVREVGGHLDDRVGPEVEGAAQAVAVGGAQAAFALAVQRVDARRVPLREVVRDLAGAVG